MALGRRAAKAPYALLKSDYEAGGEVARVPIARGRTHIVFPARDAEGVQPASVMLADLARGQWKADTDHLDGDEWPDTRQVSDKFKLLQIIRTFADTGLPTHARAINELENGIWEFKHGVKRMSFYETDGNGSVFKTTQIRAVNESPRGEQAKYWWIPQFAPQIRVGFCFAKDGKTAGADNISECERVRKEDLDYDRAA
ncbi:hypothetical protein [Curtobacterium sp. MCBA15_001]|uniref:hypothetical protein n=1 Tax=Curtobacterium sp. MCBA15_001 TaxID=1898731 RepID=UPI0011139244|nr:hypothetical protein [Curtobacterium sp. MCBA15_001]